MSRHSFAWLNIRNVKNPPATVCARKQQAGMRFRNLRHHAIPELAESRGTAKAGSWPSHDTYSESIKATSPFCVVQVNPPNEIRRADTDKVICPKCGSIFAPTKKPN